LKKIYVSDNGYINAVGTLFSDNRGRMLENSVAVELKRRCLHGGAELYYWDDFHFECDFIVKMGKQIESLYQVCFDLTEFNREREIRGLVSAMKVFGLRSGNIITFNHDEIIREKGYTIRVVPAWQWFLERS
jgi:uncharacterized protein